MSASNKSSIPLGRYRLARIALDLRSFTAAELATMAQVPTNTTYGFLAELEGYVAKRALAVSTPGRPRTLYTLTRAGIERLLSESFAITNAVREAGLTESAGLAAQAGALRQAAAAVVVQEPVGTIKEENQFVMKLTSLRQLYTEELRELHSAERQIIQVLPKMAKRTSNQRLQVAFEEILEVTKQQLERLDQIFEKLNKKATGRKDKNMEGLIEETKEMMEEDMVPEALDAVLIAAFQRIEHHEMAGYGTVRTYAQLLGETEAARLLQRSLDETGDADKRLAQLAESEINLEAAVEVPAGAA
jgi:ferritin-like metal-binding protein YciE